MINAKKLIVKKTFQKKVLTWFAQNGRKHLPWQQPATPYRVWVSEVMLQQTQVNTAIPYFERFMHAFPTIKALAQASVDQVLMLWAGLGYYARARNLHRSAQLIVSQFTGKLPADLHQLMTLPGIGRSTAGAILALGFHKKASILDGNVKRILSRLHVIEGWSGQSDVEKQLWLLAEYYTSAQSIAEYTQAMMDLGATVCTRTQPKCDVCPLAKHCVAYQTQRVKEYPQTKPKKSIPTKHCYLLLFRHPETGKFLLEKRPPVGIWGGLWALPQFDMDSDIKKIAQQQYDLKLIGKTKSLDVFRHTFSHFHLIISPLLCDIKLLPKIREQSNRSWHTAEQALALGLPRPIKKIFELGLTQNADLFVKIVF